MISPGITACKRSAEIRTGMLRKITSFGVAALLLLGASSPRVSSAELASISVSLVVQESCVIQSAADPSPIDAPSVSCHGAPYGVALVALDPTQAPSTMQFAARATQHAIWMVGF